MDLTLLADRQPSVRRLGQELLQWIGTLDYDQQVAISGQAESFAAFPTWHYEDAAIRLVISASAVSAAGRGRADHRPIGIYPFESSWVASEVSLRKALQRKGAKYGALGVPYVIAVNSLSSFDFDRIDHMEALFGKEQLVVGPGNREPIMVRKPDGFWLGPRGAQHTRVSAVLFCQVNAWNVHAAQLCLYHNPMAYYPYRGKLTTLPQATPDGNKMTWSDGVAMGRLFALASDWLGE